MRRKYLFLFIGMKITFRLCHLRLAAGHTGVNVDIRSHYGPGVDSALNRNEYQLYFLGVKSAGV